MILRSTLHYEKLRQCPEQPRMANAINQINALRSTEGSLDAREVSWVFLQMSSHGMLPFLWLAFTRCTSYPILGGVQLTTERHQNSCRIHSSDQCQTFWPWNSVHNNDEMHTAYREMGQQDLIQTMDQQLYATAQQVKWSKSLEFEHTIMHLGDFHTACCFIGAVAKLFVDAGLKDLVKSGVYAEGTVQMMLMGKQFHP